MERQFHVSDAPVEPRADGIVLVEVDTCIS
jgi:hypothetical protein